MNPREIARDLQNKHAWYWVRVLAIAGVGFLLNRWLSEHPPQWMLDLRLAIYKVVSTSGPREANIGHTAIVEITDEEFWRGELAGRRPLKRRYIAGLLTRLCQDGANVIGLDVDMRSPLPDGTLLNHTDYVQETNDLARAIQEALRTYKCKIVLARTLYCPDPPAGTCTQEPNALDPYSFDSNRVTWGYINLPVDVRQVPLRRSNVDSGKLDSFSQAIAIAESPERVSRLRSPTEFPYGSFLSEKVFKDARVVFSARDVLRDAPEVVSVIPGKTVLVGGSWHANAYGRGVLVDTHTSPVGEIPGVILHANYAAAMIDGRAYPAAGRIWSDLIEGIVIAVIAVVLALPTSWLRKWLRLGAVVLCLSALSYVFWQNLGMFLEVTIPVVLLLAHGVLDKYLDMRQELVQFRAEVERLRGRVS